MELRIYLNGDGFKPSLLNIPNLIILAEAGEIATNGRYKGGLYPYGLCYYIVNSENDFNTEVTNQKNYLSNFPLVNLNVQVIEFEDELENNYIYEPRNN